MKKTVLIIIFGFTVFLGINSQNVDDALRYSQLFYSGTARFNSMGGAFTALGGDLSSLTLNPAGIGVYRSFEITITPQLVYNNIKSTFNATGSSDLRYKFNLGQMGFVANLISNTNSTGLINLNVGYSYMRTNNFNQNIAISGISNNSSMADYWTVQSQGTYFRDLTGGAGIAYDAYVIDTITGSGGKYYGSILSNYGENTNSTYGQLIRRIIDNEGFTGEHAISIGGNYSNKFYFGATIGINTLHYTGHYQHIEDDINNVIPDFQNFSYTDHLEASGTGYGLKLGAIIKPVEFLRIGLAFHTPVVYRIHEYFYDNITSAFDNLNPARDRISYTYEESNSPLRYSYTLTTPLRALAGVAFQIEKLAILSVDYEYVDYRMAKFSNASDDYNYDIENKGIKDILKTASNIRLGAEFRVNNTIYLRGGYGYYGKAFKSGELNDNLSFNSISFGIGFRQQNFLLDLAFTSMSDSQRYLMYYDPGRLNPATLSTTKSIFTATLGYKF
jgi:hypothetical protein